MEISGTVKFIPPEKVNGTERCGTARSRRGRGVWLDARVDLIHPAVDPDEADATGSRAADLAGAEAVALAGGGGRRDKQREGDKAASGG